MTQSEWLLLWTWSTVVQLLSAAMIMVFFIVLGWTVRRHEVLLWKRAWIANFFAIVVTVLYWRLRTASMISEGTWQFALIVAAYVACKTTFVVMLLEGTWASRYTGIELMSRQRRTMVIAVFAIVCGLSIRTIPVLGIVQHSLLTVLLLGASWVAFRSKERGLNWLTVAFLLRGSAAVAEVATYATEAARAYAAVSSAFDAGIEWGIALASALVVSERIQTALRQTNVDLLKAQEELRALADRDPLTGLANRRVLPTVFRAIHGLDAKLLFFDLDGFKQINDTLGHAAGDQALIRFGNALHSSFRPDDTFVRYAGDEFVVIVAGMEQHLVDERLDGLRQRLQDPSTEGPAVRFSVGITDIKAGEKGEDALKAADASMYERKQWRKRERASA